MIDFDPVAYINEPRWQESRLGLERTVSLLDRMGRPQDRLKFVHVAGTNGKGSTCSYIASALQAAGYRTGLFTSPFIMRFEERIRVDGKDISADDLLDVTLFVREHADALEAETGEHPTEFELMTAVAFEHFVRSGCDIVVCEVGLGGRLDSTNVIDAPEVCVIARIGLDHTGVLGNTASAIAREKAGIIKRGSLVVSYPQDDPGAMQVIEDAANECGCPLAVPDLESLEVRPVEGGVRPFSYGGKDFTTLLLGNYQPSNAALAIEALRALARRGWNVGEDAIAQGIAAASWPGRFEVVEAGPPAIIVDGGHNPQGAAVLADSLRDVFPGKRIVFLMSVLADKDYRAMVRAVAGLGEAWVCVTSPNAARALSGSDLAQAVREETQDANAAVEVAPDFSRAMERARQLAGPSGVVCAFGSLYSVAEIRKAL